MAGAVVVAVAVTLAAAGLATVPFGTSGSRRWRMPGDKGEGDTQGFNV